MIEESSSIGTEVRMSDASNVTEKRMKAVIVRIRSIGANWYGETKDPSCPTILKIAEEVEEAWRADRQQLLTEALVAKAKARVYEAEPNNRRAR